jgi:NADH dehydrogenase
MRKRDHRPLQLLSVGSTLVHSLPLLLGAGLLLATWFHAVVLTAWEHGREPSLLRLGSTLARLASSSPDLHTLLVGAHVVAIVLLVVPAQMLWRRTRLGRAAKRGLLCLSLLAAGTDLAAWLGVPELPALWAAAGPLGLLASLPLLLLPVSPLRRLWLYRRWRNPDGARKRVVIVGGGFGGLNAALELDRELGYHPDLEIQVLDKRNFFLFRPLLPSTAAGSIEPRQVTFPFRQLFENTSVAFRKAQVTAVDPYHRPVAAAVELDRDGTRVPVVNQVEFPYDYLVLAPGSTHQGADTKGAGYHSFFMKDLNDAIDLRNHLIDCFERAAVIDKEDLRRELLRFVVVGGGPTGVEVATEIHDLVHNVLLECYRELDPKLPVIYLVQAAGQLLPGWDPDVVRLTTARLARMRIEIILNMRVTEISTRQVTLEEGGPIATRTCVFCAGVRPSELVKTSFLPTDRSGRIPIGDDLRVDGFPAVFVIGDSALSVDKRTQKILPALGQVAAQQGTHAARNLARLITGKATVPFRYSPRGARISVGERFAAVSFLGMRFSGFVAFLAWRGGYLADIVGLGNKWRLLVEWSLDLLGDRTVAQIREPAELHVPAAAPGPQSQSR